jgi:hypothetical protein
MVGRQCEFKCLQNSLKTIDKLVIAYKKLQINSCDSFVNDDVLRFYAVCLFTPCVLGRQMVTDASLGVSKLV